LHYIIFFCLRPFSKNNQTYTCPVLQKIPFIICILSEDDTLGISGFSSLAQKLPLLQFFIAVVLACFNMPHSLTSQYPLFCRQNILYALNLHVECFLVLSKHL